MPLHNHVIMGAPQFAIHHQANKLLIMEQKIWLSFISLHILGAFLSGSFITDQCCVTKNIDQSKFIWTKYFFSSFKLYSLMVNQSHQINCKNYRVRSELQQSKEVTVFLWSICMSFKGVTNYWNIEIYEIQILIFTNLVPRVSHLTPLLARPRGGKMRDPGNEVVFSPDKKT